MRKELIINKEGNNGYAAFTLYASYTRKEYNYVESACLTHIRTLIKIIARNTKVR